ncbi:MAG: ABC-F family ATP-binding cassette domain-containing protein, partial [Lachnospiraceae bacterium]
RIKGSEKAALVGDNGAGKTTLLRLIAGELSLDRDDRSSGGIRSSEKLLTGYLPQHVFESPEDGDRTVEEELLAAAPSKGWDRERFEYEQEYDRIFTGFGFSKEDKRKRLADFSGGQRMRIALIRLMLMKPDILLLDEPTNHLDEEMTIWLENWIRNYEKAVICVSHDRYFLDRIADHVWEVRKGKLTPYTGGYTEYVRQKREKNLRDLKEWRRQQEEVERLEALITRFKNKPRKAAFARSRKKILDRMERMEKPDEPDTVSFGREILPEVRGSGTVFTAQKLMIGYDRPLMELDLTIRRGQKIGIIGPNGIGKSTLVKTIAGKLPPLGGKGILGWQISLGYYSQEGGGEAGKPMENVIGYVRSRYPGMPEKDLRSLLASWLFKGNEVYKTLDALSGGERARLYFAVLFQDCPNFLILDEPTNHMDIRTREVLESALAAYKGTLLVVSHDRYFINRCTGNLLVFDREGIHYYPFDYDHYVKRQEQLRRYYELAGRKAAETGTQEGPDAGDGAGTGEAAQDQILRMRPEDQLLLEAFSRIPEKDRGYMKQESDDRIYESWKRRLMEEDLEKAEQEYMDALDQMAGWQLEHYEAYMAQAAPVHQTCEESAGSGELIESAGSGEPGELRELRERILLKEARWTRACIEYDQEV